jgi:hypothetical protein
MGGEISCQPSLTVGEAGVRTVAPSFSWGKTGGPKIGSPLERAKDMNEKYLRT